MQSKNYFFLLFLFLPIVLSANCDNTLEKNNYYITLDPSIDKNQVTFNLKIHNCGNEQVDLPKLRPSGSQAPKYLYVWAFGDHSAPIRTEEPTYTHTYPNANCSYVAKVEISSIKANDDELSIISYPSTIDVTEFGHIRNVEDVNLLGSKWIFVDISRIPRPNQEVTYFVTFQNELNKPVSGQIVFKYPKAYLYDYPKNNISCEIDADGVCINEPFEDLKNHQITYEFEDLKAGIQKTIPITFKVKNTVAQRTVLGCYATMYINETGQGHTACNTRKAVSSWDPNKKVVDMPAICTTEDTTLTYTIHFENEGNAEAENVVLEDLIPPTLDIESLEVIEESHLVGKPKIDPATRKVRWDFNGINLPGNKQEGYKHNFEASRGFVSYRIKIKNPETLSTGTEISASAGITFQGQKTILTPPAVTERFCFEKDCEAEAQNTSKGFIKSVSIDNTTYETEAEGFGDHSGYEFKLLRDSTYQLIIKSHILPDGFNEDAYYKVWIDYNQNGEFEEEENILTDSSKVEVLNNYVKEWDRSFGGSDVDAINRVFQAKNNDLIIGGHSRSTISNDKTESYRYIYDDYSPDYWIMGLDENGVKKWNKSYFSANFAPIIINEFVDNNYQIVSTGNPFTILNIDYTGNVFSEHTITGSSFSVNITSDSSYIFGTYTGDGNFNLAKLDKDNYSIEWSKVIESDSTDIAFSVQQTNDGGYILGGNSKSGIGGDKTTPNYGTWDYWIVKLDSNREIIWDKNYGGDEEDFLRVVQEINNEGYIVGGSSHSGISGNKTSQDYGPIDMWVLKLDQNGDTIWTKSYGGNKRDVLGSIIQTYDGGFLIGGWSSSSANSGNKTAHAYGNADFWLIKIDMNGNIEWNETFGGTHVEFFGSMTITNDGGLILGGESYSSISGNKNAPNKGDSDYWIVKLAPIGGATNPESIVQITFTLPSTAQLGRTGMRIASQFNATPNNCGTYTYGEVEEYTINILETNPDLLFEEVELEAETVTVGENAELDLTVRNEGNVAVNGTFEVNYYLSTDVLFTSDDIELGSNVLNALAVEESQSMTNVSFTIPSNTEAGIYYILLLADADSVHQEINEANNLNYQKINLIAQANTPADLALENPFLFPATVVQEDSTTVTYTLKNYGGSSMTPTVSYYLSDNESLNVGTDLLLGTDTWSSLESGGSSCHNQSLTIPNNSNLGSQYLLIVLENTDAGLSNNQISLAIEVEDQAPDLKIVANSLTLTPNPVAIGGEITICGTIENTGGGTGSHSYITYTLDIVSCETEDGIGLNYKELIDDLGEGASIPFCSTFTLLDNVTSGSYYIQVKADGLDFVNELTASSQAGENNNVETVEVIVEGAVADLTIRNEALSTSSVAAGESVNLVYEAENLQAKSAAAHYVKYYLVADTTDFSAEQLSGDVFLGHRYLSKLEGSSSDLINHPFITIPDTTAFGDWYLAWVIDGNGTISEASEVNNFAFEAIKVIAPLVDECEEMNSIVSPNRPSIVEYQTVQQAVVQTVFQSNTYTNIGASGHIELLPGTEAEGGSTLVLEIRDCPCADLMVSNLEVVEYSNSFITYNYELLNVGTTGIYLDGATEIEYDNLSVQAYLSSDMVFNNEGDIPAGGGIIDISPLGILLPTETFEGFRAASIPPLDLNATPYLVLKVDWGEINEECDEGNNTLAVLIDENGNVSGKNALAKTSNDLQFHLYPNPANDECFFHFEMPESGDLRLTVLDVVGKVHFQEEKALEAGLWVQNVDLYDLPMGVYFVQVEMGDDVEFERLVVVQ